MIRVWKHTINGNKAFFAFSIDEQLHESMPSDKKPYFAWKIKLSVTFKNGKKLNREYTDLPVFKTKQLSSIQDKQAFAKESEDTIKMHQAALDKIMPFTRSELGGFHLNYPIGRSLWGILFIIVGLFFIILGLFIPDIIFNIVFPAVGGLAVLGGIYSLFNAIDIHINPVQIETKHYLFGILTKSTKLISYEIKDFISKKSHSTTAGNTTTQYYNIYALGHNDKKALVVEGLEGMGQVREATNRLKTMMNIKD